MIGQDDEEEDVRHPAPGTSHQDTQECTSGFILFPRVFRPLEY